MSAIDMPNSATVPHEIDMPPSGMAGVPMPASRPGSTAPVGSAIGNAVNYATGLTLRELPITPERLWRALREHERTGKTEFGAEDLPQKFASMPPLPERR